MVFVNQLLVKLTKIGTRVNPVRHQESIVLRLGFNPEVQPGDVRHIYGHPVILAEPGRLRRRRGRLGSGGIQRNERYRLNSPLHINSGRWWIALLKQGLAAGISAR